MSTGAPLSPYKGLTPFEDSDLDVRFFFGRERDRELIEANLMASRLTVLYGETGVGKSSVLRAGVAHHLRATAERNLRAHGEPGIAVIVFDAWRDDPLQTLRAAIAEAVTHALGGSLQPPDEEVSLIEALRTWGTLLDGDIYVILDQVEEYFLYHPGEDRQDSFAVEFPAVVNTPGLRVNFILAVREDAIAKLDVFKGRIPNVLGNYLRLEHLDRVAARQAIVEPVRAYNELVPEGERVEIEPRLVDAVLEQVVTGKLELGQSGRGTVAVGEGEVRIETAYLQLVMYRLWDEERNGGSRVLRLETLRRLGGAEQIVRDHVDEALTGLTAEQKDFVARMFDHLVTPSGAKIAHGVDDLAEYAGAPEADVLPVLTKLGNERILRSIAANGAHGSGYEIFHDVLAQPLLAWKAGHERERERVEAERRQKRLHRLLALAAAAVVVMAAVTVFAVIQWSDARSQARLAHGRELAGAAQSELNVDPFRSFLLALQSAHLRHTSQAEDVLRAALAANRERAILPSNGAVRTVAFSPDGSHVLTAGADGTARLWRPDGTPVRTLAHGGPVTAATFSPDGSLVLTAGADHTAHIWRTANGSTVAILPHRGRVTDASFSADGTRVVTASADRAVRVWSVPSGELLRVIPLSGTPRSAAFSLDGRTLLTTSGEPTGGHVHARLFDAATGRLLRTLPVDDVSTASFSPDGTLLVTGRNDGSAVLWQVRGGPRLHTLPGIGGKVTDAVFSPGGALLAVTHTGGATGIWYTGSGTRSQLLRGHATAVNHASFSSDGKLLVTAGADGTARIWRTGDGGAVAVLRGPPGTSVADAVFSPDGNTVATASSDDGARLWDATDLRVLAMSRKPERAAAFSPDGRLVVTAGDDGTAQILTVQGRRLHVLPHPAPVRSATFTTSGSRVITDDSEGTLRVWDASTGKLVGLARNVSRGPLAVSRDGRLLVAPTLHGSLGVWSISDLERARLFKRGGPYTAAAFSPDGQLIAAAGETGLTRLLDARTGAVMGVLRGHTDTVTGVNFNDDGSLLVTSSRDHDARIWDLATGKSTVLSGHFGPVLGASFSPDGRWVVTAGPTSAGLWAVSTGDRIAFLVGDTNQLTSASFSPDSSRILTASLDKTARIYVCDLCGGFGELVAAADARLAAISGPLTPAARERFLGSP